MEIGQLYINATVGLPHEDIGIEDNHGQSGTLDLCVAAAPLSPVHILRHRARDHGNEANLHE